jgi:hypothetical protein
MLKHAIAAASLTALLASPSFAQTTQSNQPMNARPNTSATVPPANQTRTDMQFLNMQTSNEWRSSQLIGATVTGANNQNIGEINEVLIDNSGMVKAVVVGVGGFLGMGEKNVAIPFASLNVTRQANDNDIEKVTVSFTKQQLEQAPSFSYLDARDRNRQSTGAAPATTTPATAPKR